MPRFRLRVAMVLLFGATSLQAIHQSATEDIATLTIWQAVNAVLAAVVAVGFWRSTPGR